VKKLEKVGVEVKYGGGVEGTERREDGKVERLN